MAKRPESIGQTVNVSLKFYKSIDIDDKRINVFSYDDKYYIKISDYFEYIEHSRDITILKNKLSFPDIVYNEDSSSGCSKGYYIDVDSILDVIYLHCLHKLEHRVKSQELFQYLIKEIHGSNDDDEDDDEPLPVVNNNSVELFDVEIFTPQETEPQVITSYHKETFPLPHRIMMSKEFTGLSEPNKIRLAHSMKFFKKVYDNVVKYGTPYYMNCDDKSCEYAGTVLDSMTKAINSFLKYAYGDKVLYKILKIRDEFIEHVMYNPDEYNDKVQKFRKRKKDKKTNNDIPYMAILLLHSNGEFITYMMDFMLSDGEAKGNKYQYQGILLTQLINIEKLATNSAINTITFEMLTNVYTTSLGVETNMFNSISDIKRQKIVCNRSVMKNKYFDDFFAFNDQDGSNDE